MLAHNRSGNYRFLASEGRPFSDGAVADLGYDLVHAKFERPIPLEAGLAAAARQVLSSGRTVSAIAAFELRIPAPLTDADFDSFNRGYVSKLKVWAWWWMDFCQPREPMWRLQGAKS